LLPPGDLADGDLAEPVVVPAREAAAAAAAAADTAAAHEAERVAQEPVAVRGAKEPSAEVIERRSRSDRALVDIPMVVPFTLCGLYFTLCGLNGGCAVAAEYRELPRSAKMVVGCTPATGDATAGGRGGGGGGMSIVARGGCGLASGLAAAAGLAGLRALAVFLGVRLRGVFLP